MHKHKLEGWVDYLVEPFRVIYNGFCEVFLGQEACKNCWWCKSDMHNSDICTSCAAKLGLVRNSHQFHCRHV